MLGDNMILLHKDLQNQGFSNYQIQNLVKKKALYFINKGIYSTTSEVNYLEVISKKHPNAIFTLETACYCYGLIDTLEEPYVIATKQKDRKINDEKVKQIFMKDNLYSIGINSIKFQNINIKLYDLERLLIDVIRNKKNMDFDKYEKIINSYKKLSKILNKRKLELYLPNFKDPKIIMRIKKEVFDEK